MGYKKRAKQIMERTQAAVEDDKQRMIKLEREINQIKFSSILAILLHILGPSLAITKSDLTTERRRNLTREPMNTPTTLSRC